MFGLNYLIAPHTPESFLDEYYLRRAVFIPGDASKFEHLFGWADVNHLLNTARGSYEGLRLLYEKKPQPSSSLKRIEHWLEKGATLVINHVNQIDPVVQKFQRLLSSELNARVNINSYMSYPSKQGFDTHYDRHDVFIVATAGEKEWSVYEPTKPFPLHRQKEPSGDPPEGDPYLTCTMTPGDVLYIPRGHWHYALARTPSIHLTVGPEARCGIYFLDWLSRYLMASEEFFREDFPVARIKLFGGDRGNNAYRCHMDEFRNRLRDLLDDEAKLDELFVRHCMEENSLRREYQLPKSWRVLENMTPDTEFIIPAEQKAVVFYDDETSTGKLVLRNRTIELVGIPNDLLAAILSVRADTISGAGMLARFPSVRWDDLKNWLGKMYSGGFLRLPDIEVENQPKT